MGGRCHPQPLIKRDREEDQDQKKSTGEQEKSMRRRNSKLRA
jgi:hypothetical protein